MKSLAELKESLAKLKPVLQEKYPLEKLAIFGSYVRNEQTKLSDVDILAEFNGNIGIRFIDLAEEIEEALGVKVDLVSKGGLKEKYYKALKDELEYV